MVLGNKMSRARAVLWMSTGLTREQMITLLGAQAQITSTSHPECAMLRELGEKWCRCTARPMETLQTRLSDAGLQLTKSNVFAASILYAS